MKSLLIANALIVNEGTRTPADVLLRGDRIERIAPSLPADAADDVLDADGAWLLPGMIDAHVHCREPGMEAKGDLLSETRAALAGGVTSIMDMPNTRPAVLDRDALEEKFALAEGRSATNYSFYLGASNDNVEELLALDPRGVCGVKLFMGASTGNLLVDRESALERIFAAVRLPLTVHCEYTPLIQANERAARERYGDAIPFSAHPEIRSREACLRSARQAVELAERHQTRLHVLHLSTAEETALFAPGPVEGKRVTAEACPHHLLFSDADYERLGARMKCNPAIKTAEDREALRQAVLDGRIDAFGTDHAPHLPEEKNRPYAAAPSGMPGIGEALPLLMELFDPETVVEKYAHNPARIFDVEERGFVREGYRADLVLFDPDRPGLVEPRTVRYKCGWSPYEGMRFSGAVRTVLLNGAVAFRDGRLAPSIHGRRLAFDR